MATDTAPRTAVAERVAAARIDADRSVAWLARRARISPTSLRRKLDGDVDFTVWELADIARALGLRISHFLPEGWDDADAVTPAAAKAA
ncbi:helix-turn-helix domain-containing protein [Microbacterium arborescens]